MADPAFQLQLIHPLLPPGQVPTPEQRAALARQQPGYVPPFEGYGPLVIDAVRQYLATNDPQGYVGQVEQAAVDIAGKTGAKTAVLGTASGVIQTIPKFPITKPTLFIYGLPAGIVFGQLSLSELGSGDDGPEGFITLAQAIERERQARLQSQPVIPPMWLADP